MACDNTAIIPCIRVQSESMTKLIVQTFLSLVRYNHIAPVVSA